MQHRSSYDRVKCECFILPAVGCCQIICEYFRFISSCFKNNCGKCFVITTRRERCSKQEQTVITGSILKHDGKACDSRERKVEFKTSCVEIPNETPKVILDLNENINNIHSAIQQVKFTAANTANHLKKKEVKKVQKDINNLEVKLNRLKKKVGSGLCASPNRQVGRLPPCSDGTGYRGEYERKKLQGGTFRPFLLDTLCNEHRERRPRSNVGCIPGKRINTSRIKCYCYQCRRKEALIDKRCGCKNNYPNETCRRKDYDEISYQDERETKQKDIQLVSRKKNKDNCEKKKCRHKKCKKCKWKDAEDYCDDDNDGDTSVTFHPIIECKLRKSISDLTRLRRLRALHCYQYNGHRKHDLPLYQRVYKQTYPYRFY